MHGEMEAMALLPGWLRAVWVTALCGVLVTHLRHAYVIAGQSRWWHVGHAVMATGMALMYLLPHMQHPGVYRVGVVLFGLLALAAAVKAVLLRRREGVFNPLWLMSSVDMFVMAYMSTHGLRTAPLTWLLIAYLLVQAVAWAVGTWIRIPVFASRPRVGQDTDMADVSAVPVRIRRLGLTPHSTVAVRTTLAVMAASMAYMLAVM